MKNFSALPVKAAGLFLCTIFLFSCNKGKSADAFDKDTSYAFGMFMAQVCSEMMGLRDAHFDYNAFMEGFKAFIEEEETRISWDTAMEKINAAFEQAKAVSDEKNRLEGEAYLAENGARSGVLITASGLQYEVISQGSGEKPGIEDTVLVHYEGTFINGNIFDSSYRNGSPREIPVNKVIPGWSEGLQLMNVGSTYRFVIPSDLAYGPNGAGDVIPPNSALIFKVELLSIVK